MSSHVPHLNSMSHENAVSTLLPIPERDAPDYADFLLLMAHELRSPLQAMDSWVHVLEAVLVDSSPQAGRALAGIRTGVVQQLEILDWLSDVSKLPELGPVTADPHSDCTVLLESAVGVVADEARLRNVHLRRHIALHTVVRGEYAVLIARLVHYVLHTLALKTPVDGVVWLWVEESSMEGARNGISVRMRHGPQASPRSSRTVGNIIDGDETELVSANRLFSTTGPALNRLAGGRPEHAWARLLAEALEGRIEVRQASESTDMIVTLSIPIKRDWTAARKSCLGTLRAEAPRAHSYLPSSD